MCEDYGVVILSVCYHSHCYVESEVSQCLTVCDQIWENLAYRESGHVAQCALLVYSRNPKNVPIT